MSLKYKLIGVFNAFLKIKDRIRPTPESAKTAVFQRIFNKKEWGRSESVSGYGSTLEATEKIRRALPVFFDEHNVRTVIDVPCGDLFWIKEIFDHIQHYIGLDIVPEIIAENQKKYTADKFTFLLHDITRDPLRKADVIIVRDLFIHFPEKMIKEALRNIINSDIRYCMFSNYPKIRHYKEIQIGGCRSVNLLEGPFHLPPPSEVIEEDWTDKNLSVWEIADLKEELNRTCRWW